MYCNNCGKKIINKSKFCEHCGSKIDEENKEDNIHNKKEKNVTKISLKKSVVLIIVGIFLLISLIAFGVFLSNSKQKVVSNEDDMKSSNEKNNVIETYELNKIGLFKGSNILEEKYDSNNNLTFCKYKFGDTIANDEFNYEYDDKKRVTKINYIGYDGTKKYESSLQISYNEDKISNILTTTSYQMCRYEFLYNSDFVSIKKYTKGLNDLITNSVETDYEFEALFNIYKKKINEIDYGVIIEYNKDNKIENKRIYEINENQDNNIFQTLGIIPNMQYIELLNIRTHSNCIANAFVGIGLSMPIINQGNLLYKYNKNTSGKYNETKYYYDKYDRELCYEYLGSDNNNEYRYHKYENTENNSYVDYEIYDFGKNYSTAGAEGQYNLYKKKFYINEEKQIIKYEDLESKTLTKEKFMQMKQEYEQYINENKIDSNNIINEFNTTIENDNYNNIIENEENNQKENNKENNSINENNIIQNDINNNPNITEKSSSKTINNLNNNKTISSEDEITTKLDTKILRMDDGGSYETGDGNYKLSILVDIETNGDWYEEAKKLTASVNGNDMKLEMKEAGPSFNLILKLNEGNNTFDVKVTTGTGNVKTKSFNKTYTKND